LLIPDRGILQAMSSARFPYWLLLLAAVMAGCQRAATVMPEAGPVTVETPSTFGGSMAGEERVVDGMKLCWCPPGRFTMGSPPGEPERRPGEDQVEVALTRGFWAGKYEVTQG